ncbi:hypothetical protein [Streptomyces sp.]|nr:hypothetical protein [Streptomyces sp.]HET6355017.1 hypothetical protein [Streptomyces sp.]
MNLAGGLAESVAKYLLRMVPLQVYAGLAVGIAVIVLLVMLRRRAQASG